MKSQKKEILGLITKISVILIIFIFTIIYYDQLTNIDIREIASSSSGLLLTALSILLIYLIKGLVCVIPASLIYISVGLVFSPFSAVAVNMCGILIEVLASYLLGAFLGGKYVEKLMRKNNKSEKLLDFISKDKPSSIFLARLLPVFPIDFTSLFLGSIRYPFIKYVIFSVVGIAPRVIVLTILGDKIYDYIPMELIIKTIIFLIPVAAVAIVVRWLIVKVKKQKNVE